MVVSPLMPREHASMATPQPIWVRSPNDSKLQQEIFFHVAPADVLDSSVPK